MEKFKVSIITVNYNQLAVTCELLESIRNNTYKNIEIIVVDNASKENPEAYLRQHYPEAITIISPENLGFAGGNNLGVAQCTGDFLLFINNDAELTDGCIERLLAVFDRVPKLGIISPKLCYFNETTDQPDILQYVGTTTVHPLTARNETIGTLEPDNGQYDKPAHPTAYAHGAAMMVPREVIDKVGPMAELFFLYYEELDWCDRIRRAGYEIYIEPNALVYHKESLSTGKTSTLKTYYLNRNRILYMRRNRSSFQFLAFTLFLIGATIPKNVLTFLVKGQFDHIKHFLKAIWWNYSPFQQQTKQQTVVTTKPSVRI